MKENGNSVCCVSLPGEQAEPFVCFLLFIQGGVSYGHHVFFGSQPSGKDDFKLTVRVQEMYVIGVFLPGPVLPGHNRSAALPGFKIFMAEPFPNRVENNAFNRGAPTFGMAGLFFFVAEPEPDLILEKTDFVEIFEAAICISAFR